MAYGDPAVVVDVKESERGEIIYTDRDGKTCTYYPASSVWMEVQTLEVLTLLGDPHEKDAVPPLITRVHGTAKLEDNSIAVLGDPTSRARTLSFSCEASDWRPPRDEQSNPLLHKLGDIGGASLGFNRADWEIGNADDWWCACYLPQHFMDALVADIRSAQVHRLRFSLELSRLYTDVHSLAPVSMRGCLFIRPSLGSNSINSPDSPFGWVRSIVYASASMDLREMAPAEADESVDEEVKKVDDAAAQEPLESQVAAAIRDLATHVDRARITMKYFGFMIIAILIIFFLK